MRVVSFARRELRELRADVLHDRGIGALVDHHAGRGMRNEDVAHAVLHAAFSDDPLDFAVKLDELAALERLDDKFLDVHHFRSFYALASANAASSSSLTAKSSGSSEK